MNPGQRDITVYRGALYDEVFVFTATVTGAAINVAALTFTMLAKHANSETLLLTFTTSHNDAGGTPLATNKIRVTAAATLTDDLIVGDSVIWGIRDQYNNYYGFGKVNVLQMVPI